MQSPRRMARAFAAAALFLTLGVSCKKGEDDPAISLLSRKARLAGVWRLESGSASITANSPNDRYNETFTFDSKSYKQNYTPDGGQLTVYIGTYILDLTVLKDGTFTMKENLFGHPLEAKGSWSFNDGIGKEKKKEDVMFFIESVSSGSTDDEHLFNRWGVQFTYHLTELRGKKLVIHSSGRIYSGSDGYIDFSTDYTFIQ